MANRVDAPMNAMQAPGGDSSGYSRFAESGGNEIAASNDPMLPSGTPGNHLFWIGAFRPHNG